MNYYLSVLQDKYATFTGRASRSEFWYFILFNIIVSFILGIVDGIIGMKILGTIYSLAVLIPSLAVGARRLHDIGKSGWMQLLGLIPVIGWIWLIVLFAQESHK
jgi:uncharacterized membrane protein YhaH (DUF805 family)